MSIYFDENGKICYKNEKKESWFSYDWNNNSYKPVFDYQGYNISTTSNDDYQLYIEQVIDPYSFKPTYRYHLKRVKPEKHLLEDELFEL